MRRPRARSGLRLLSTGSSRTGSSTSPRTLERKVASFAHYETERRDYPHPRSERAIRAAAEFYGAELRVRVRRAVRARSRARARLNVVVATAADARRPRAARRDRGCVRRHRATQARAEPDHRDPRRPRLLTRLRVRPRRRRDLVRPATSRDRHRATFSTPSGEVVRTLVRDRREPAGRVSYTWDGRDDLERVVAGGHLPTACAARAERTDDRPPEPDSRRHDAPADHAGQRPSTCVLARRRRTARPRDCEVPTRREGAGGAARGRVAAGARASSAAARASSSGSARSTASRCGRARTRFGSVRSTGPGTGRRGPAPSRCASATSSSRRDRIEVVAGKRFSVFVSTDAETYRWLFAGERGVRETRVLVLRAPETPGTYALYVTVGDHADRAEVVVTEPAATP